MAYSSDSPVLIVLSYRSPTTFDCCQLVAGCFDIKQLFLSVEYSVDFLTSAVTMFKILIAILLCSFALIKSSPILEAPNAIGGVEVESITQFPYQVAMFVRFSLGSSLCSGAILSKKLVITCAHCLVGSNSVNIFYGSKSFSDLDFNQNQVVSNENYHIHPQYNDFDKFFNDIALISMNSAILFSGECWR